MIKSLSGDRAVLDGKEIDILLPTYNIGIEFNGTKWHSDKVVQSKYGITAKQYHRKKVDGAKAKDYTLFFVWANDWSRDKNAINKAIENVINGGKPSSLLTKLTLTK